MLINAYVALMQRKIGWDFEDESPGRDARGLAAAMPPDVETHLVNTVLTNGAGTTSTMPTPRSPPRVRRRPGVVRWDRPPAHPAAVDAGRPLGLPPGAEIVVHKNNSDGKGNSRYGCHENYLLAREVPFGRIVAHITPAS